MGAMHGTDSRCYFNPRSPCGERPGRSCTSTASADFNPRSPCGERLCDKLSMYFLFHISIHAPHAGSDGVSVDYLLMTDMISIHAPHAGSDSDARCGGQLLCDFNPRSPCGERRVGSTPSSEHFYFNPRSPCGERRDLAMWEDGARQFQSTLPMRGATHDARVAHGAAFISIHAPHAGSDMSAADYIAWKHQFQSTLPMRGATSGLNFVISVSLISIHAPHAGSDVRALVGETIGYISIHAPHAGSDFAAASLPSVQPISIHAPHAGSDERIAHGIEGRPHISIHAPHAGSDPPVSKPPADEVISIHAPHAGSDRYIVYANIKCSAIYWTIEQLICCYCISSRHLLNLCTTFKVRRVLAHDDHLEFAPQNDKNPCGS